MNDYKYLLKNKKTITKDYFVILLEPLTDNNDLNYNKKMLRRLYRLPINIISYSKVNLELAMNALGNKREYFLLPINYYNYKDIKIDKSIDLIINHRNISKYYSSRKNYNR